MSDNIFGFQFYPTSAELVDKMMDMVDWSKVTSLLEPSAGKGDILDGIARLKTKEKIIWIKSLRHCKRDKETGSWGTYVTDYTCVGDDKLDDFVKYINQKWDKHFTDYDNAAYWVEESASDENTKWVIAENVKTVNKAPKIECTMDCIELDPNLCAILRGKHYKTTNADFLKYDCLQRYDCILMNPPFAQGEHHLLKALKLLEHGGQCVCILNAETIKNPCNNWRQELIRQLDRYNASIEFIEGAFTEAENTTDVEIAFIYVNIPKEMDEDLLKNLIKGEEYDREYEEFNDTQLATDDIVGNLVKQYDLEAKLGIKIIDDFYSMQKYIPTHKDYDTALLSLSVLGWNPNETKVKNPVNQYLMMIRDKYWSLLFMSKEMGNLLTMDSRTKYQNKLNEFRDYDFTVSNIRQLQLDMVQNLSGNIEEAILKEFDTLSYKYSMDNSQNVHYFNGWKQNTGFCIKSKVIVPMYGIYNTRWQSYDIYKCRDYLSELEKIFVYLDGGKTEGDDCFTILSRYTGCGKKYNGERLSLKYFDIELKKKGTVHIWFKNEQLLKKFNIFGCQKHGWLPDCYGKKAYKNMTKEEQEVVDSFEGKVEYEKVFADPSKYIGNGQLLQLMGG